MGNEEGIVFTLEVNVIIANSLRALHDYPFKAHVLKSQAVRRVPMQMSGRTALSGVTCMLIRRGYVGCQHRWHNSLNLQALSRSLHLIAEN